MISLGNLRRPNYILIGILVVATVVRFVGTRPGYNQYHADEGITYSTACSMVLNGNLDPLRYDYPALVPLINLIFFRIIFVPLGWLAYFSKNIGGILDGVVHIPVSELEAKKILYTQIVGDRCINALFWGRYVTALFSVGNVVLTYLLAKKLFGKNIALVAAVLLAFNFKHVANSHIGLPDIYNSFFVLLTMITAFKVLNKANRRNYVLAGLAFGLSFSVKYQIFGIVPLLMAHACVSYENGKLRLKKLFNVDFVMAGALSVLVFVLVNPYHFVDLPRTIEIVSGVSRKYAMGVQSMNFFPFSYLYHIDYGPVEFWLIIVGIVLAFAHRERTKVLVLFMYVFSFMFVMIYFSGGGFYVRNFITVTPIFLIFAALAIVKLFERFSVIAIGVVVIAAIYVPGRNAVINSYNYTKPWGYDIMRPWIAENLPKDAVVAAHPFDARNLNIGNTRTEFERAGNYAVAEHLEDGVDYAIMNLNWAGDPFYFWMNYGPEDLALYWEKPLKILRNTFHGIAAEEHFRYMVHFVSKPWQAPDTHLIVIKLPKWPKVVTGEIARFSFEEDENWVTTGGGVERQAYTYDEGAVLYKKGGVKYPTLRFVSPPILARAGHIYKVLGRLKTERELGPSEREGFLRIDFYENENGYEDVGRNSVVSSRVYGTKDWVEKTIVGRAPKGAKYLRVSFQTYVTTKVDIWLDDVVVLESQEIVEDIANEGPYNIQEVDLNFLYPNSHGNL